MSRRDRRLGMDADISRRDFLNGVAIAIGAALVPSAPAGAASVSRYYPPELTGLRGSHPGSFEVAHAAVGGKRWDRPAPDEHYDLVVVGAGISGLSAAYFYLRDVDAHARILVLDNHDDFGGHAKRNEFNVDGRFLIGYGGTMLIEAPAGYPKVAKALVEELGIDTSRFYTAFDQELYASLGLSRGTFFDQQTFEADRLVVGSLRDPNATNQAPLSDAAKSQLVRLLVDDQDYLPGKTPAERIEILERLSYRDYLAEFAKAGEEVLAYFQARPKGVWAIGSDAFPAWMAQNEGYPGFTGMDRDESDGAPPEPYIFHFPDGNASIARLLVRRLIPEVAPGDTMEDIVTAPFDYSKLDQRDASVGIRLNSTVVDMRHRKAGNRGDVLVTYVRDGRARSTAAGKVVWAGYNAMVPHVCAEVPDNQAAALRNCTRAPLVYTNVVIRNWKSFEKLGLHRAYCPGSFYHSVRLDYPVSLGTYECPKSPDEPIVLHLQHVPISPGLSASEQFSAGRAALLQESFETFERKTRDQLGRMLGGGGFDPARDIAAITVNRWPHGYAYGSDPRTGDVAFDPERWAPERRTWVTARQRFANISFAGIDAASDAMTEVAIEEAYRAVHELQ